MGDVQSDNFARTESKIEDSALPSRTIMSASTPQIASEMWPALGPRPRVSLHPPPAIRVVLNRRPPALSWLERRRQRVPHALGIFQRAPRAQRHAGQGIVGNGNGQAGFLPQNLVEIGQERPAAGEHDALLDA